MRRDFCSKLHAFLDLWVKERKVLCLKETGERPEILLSMLFMRPYRMWHRLNKAIKDSWRIRYSRISITTPFLLTMEFPIWPQITRASCAQARSCAHLLLEFTSPTAIMVTWATFPILHRPTGVAVTADPTFEAVVHGSGISIVLGKGFENRCGFAFAIELLESRFETFRGSRVSDRMLDWHSGQRAPGEVDYVVEEPVGVAKCSCKLAWFW